MKKLFVAGLLALGFTTGFTCSKNTPEETAPAVEAAPEAVTGEAAPTGEAPVEAPAEGQPAGETK